MQAMGSLHNWLSQCISGKIPWCRNRIWEYPPIDETLSDAGLDPTGGYISQRHISAALYIATRPIFDLAVAEGKRMRSPVTIILREQEGIWFRNKGRGAEES